MEFHPCKIVAAAAALIFTLLLTNGAGKAAIAEKIGGDQCYSVYHSNTFKGPCVTDPPCIAACAREGHPGGLCFFDVGHRVCICTAPCPPPPATTTTSSRGDTVYSLRSGTK